jgi:protein required for attachment to host cells
MAKALSLWIAIADGEHARFVQPDNNNTLRTVLALDSVSAHQRSTDLGSDRPGRSFESATTGSHGVAPRHDPHVLEKERFAHLVAAQLGEAAARGAFDELVLVAPAHVLNELREELDAAAASRLVGTLAKDLVKTPDGELWPHVREWVSPVRRPPA